MRVGQIIEQLEFRKACSGTDTEGGCRGGAEAMRRRKGEGVSGFRAGLDVEGNLSAAASWIKSQLARARLCPKISKAVVGGAALGDLVSKTPITASSAGTKYFQTSLQRPPQSATELHQICC